MRSIVTLLGLSILLATPLVAQVGGEPGFQRRFAGQASYRHLGRSVTYVGDINADGFADIAFGGDGDPGGLRDLGAVRVVSGNSSQILFERIGTSHSYYPMPFSGVGDVDGDGVDDLGLPELDFHSSSLYTSMVNIYSGATGQLIYRFDDISLQVDLYYARVSGAGDVDGDGFADIIIGAPFATSYGHLEAGAAFVFSGATGNLLHRLRGGEPGIKFGSTVDGAGDLDGDGFDDLLIAAPYTSISGSGRDAGSVFVISGATGQRLFRYDGRGGFHKLGFSLAGLGDLDGDGTPDFIVGEPWARVDGVNFIGAAIVFSGATGVPIFIVEGETVNGYFGYSCANAGDIDDDGTDDFIVGTPRAPSPSAIDAGSFSIYSGATGLLLVREFGEGANAWLGTSVSSAGDVDGDGNIEVIVGAAEANTAFTDAGAVFVYDFEPFLNSSTYSVSAAAGGVVNFTLDFPEAAGGDEYKILISATGMGPSTYGVRIPLTMDNMMTDSLNGIYPFNNYVGLHGTLSISGEASASITMAPGLPISLVGRPFWFAAIAGPAGGLPEYSSVAVPIKVTN